MQIIFRCDPALIDLLPRPTPASLALPDWIRNMPMTAFSELHGQDIRTVKQCPPFIDAMTHGFIIPLPCDLQIENGVLSWDWDLPQLEVPGHTRSPISFHPPAQVINTPFHNTDTVVVKFNSFWTIELEPGWSLFATHPVNRDDLPFRLLTGLVDADQFHDVGIFFPAVWTQPDFTGVLPKGTPVAQCFAVPRATPQLVFEGFRSEHIERYVNTTAQVLSTPGVYRKQFRVRRKSSSDE